MHLYSLAYLIVSIACGFLCATGLIVNQWSRRSETNRPLRWPIIAIMFTAFLISNASDICNWCGAPIIKPARQQVNGESRTVGGGADLPVFEAAPASAMQPVPITSAGFKAAQRCAGLLVGGGCILYSGMQKLYPPPEVRQLMHFRLSSRSSTIISDGHFAWLGASSSSPEL
jgi:hypothetical protein